MSVVTKKLLEQANQLVSQADELREIAESRDGRKVNEYRPWLETRESELGYYKRRFLEESARVEALEEVVEVAREVMKAWDRGECHWTPEFKIIRGALAKLDNETQR